MLWVLKVNLLLRIQLTSMKKQKNTNLENNQEQTNENKKKHHNREIETLFFSNSVAKFQNIYHVFDFK